MGDGDIHNSYSDLTLRPGDRAEDAEFKEFKEFKDVTKDGRDTGVRSAAADTDTQTRWTGSELERKCTADECIAIPPLPLTPDVGPPPDGGWEAWNCAVSASFVTFCLMGFGEPSKQITG